MTEVSDTLRALHDLLLGRLLPSHARSILTAADEMDRLATLEAALHTIQSAIPGYLKGEMTEHDFALLVLEQADSSIVSKALEGRK